MIPYLSYVLNGEEKHALREFPLDLKFIETCVICIENHETKKFPSILGLKVVFQEEIAPHRIDPLFFCL